MSSIFSNGQSIKKIKNQISNDQKEIYNVLELNDTMKHGVYELYQNKWLKIKGKYNNGKKSGVWKEFIYNGNTVSEGKYDDNLKIGLWVEYHYNSKKKSEGEYEKDKRIGTWKFYNIKGELVQLYDFVNDKLTTTDVIEDKSSIGVRGGKYDGLIFLDKNPSFDSGPTGLLKFISNNFQNPNNAREEKINGKVFISAIVNENGILSDFKVEKGLEKSIDEEALRILKLTSGKWTQGEFEGEKVVSKIAIPIMIGN